MQTFINLEDKYYKCRSRMDRSIAHNLLKRFKNKAGSYINRARSWTSRRYLVSKAKDLKTWLSSEGVQYVPYLKSYGAYIFIYGFILNYALHILLSYPLNPYTVPAWGIAYYLVIEDVPARIEDMIRTIRGFE